MSPKRTYVGGGLYRNVSSNPKTQGKEPWLYDFEFKGQRYCDTTGHTSLPRARRWLDIFKAGLADARVGIMPECTLTLRELYTEWRKVVGPSLTAHTLQVSELRLRLHLAAIADCRVMSLTALDMQKIRTDYLTKAHANPLAKKNAVGHARSGANKVVAEAVKWLRWGVLTGLVPGMPFLIQRLKPVKKVKVVLWPEQVEPFLAAVRATERHVDAGDSIQAQATLGLREEEALGMRWEWVSWRQHTYTVGEAKNFEPRTIPMMESFEARLRTRWKDAGKPTHGLVFPGEDGKGRRPGYTRKPTARGGVKLGIKGLHPHCLRATFATNHFEIGTEISQIQQMMGHKSPETTWIYIVQREKNQVAAQAKAEEAMQLVGFVPAPKKPKKKKKATKPRSRNSPAKKAS